MSATYSIYTSPHHPPVPEHLPTLIVTPHGRPQQVLYTFLHTNVNTENYLLTPAPEGDLCVAKLYPPDRTGSLRNVGAGAGTSSSGHGGSGGAASVRCEAGRGLSWRIVQTGIQNPVYKILLPNPELPGEDQPLFQVSKPNPNAPFWTLTYFAYAGHLIPPRRVEFGRISTMGPEQGGGTRLAITGRTEEEQAVWASLGPGNQDAVEWLVVCATLVILDDDMVAAAGAPSWAKVLSRPPSPQKRSAAHSGGAMRVVAPVEMQSGVPRSASSSHLVPAVNAARPASTVSSRGPSPNRYRHGGSDPRLGPPQTMPSTQQRASPAQEQELYHARTVQQQQQPEQQYYQHHDPAPMQARPPPREPPAALPHQGPISPTPPPPRSSSHSALAGAAEASRPSSNYRAGAAGAMVPPSQRGPTNDPHRDHEYHSYDYGYGYGPAPGYGNGTGWGAEGASGLQGADAGGASYASYGYNYSEEKGPPQAPAQGQRLRMDSDVLQQRRLVKERHR